MMFMIVAASSLGIASFRRDIGPSGTRREYFRSRIRVHLLLMGNVSRMTLCAITVANDDLSLSILRFNVTL